MIPSIIVNIVELIVCLLYGIFIIPICSLFFWDETKDYFIALANSWLEIDSSNTTTMMSILMVSLAVWTGLFCFYSYFCRISYLFLITLITFHFLFFHSNSVVFDGRHCVTIWINENCKCEWRKCKCQIWCGWTSLSCNSTDTSSSLGYLIRILQKGCLRIDAWTS